MRFPRSIHLLITVAILFSQIVSGIHMAGHVSGHAIEMTSAPAESPMIASSQADHKLHHTTHQTAAEHDRLHRQPFHVSASSDSGQGQNYFDQSCVIYHLYAGSHCVAISPVMILAGSSLELRQQTMHAAAPSASRLELNSIRGPPTIS